MTAWFITLWSLLTPTQSPLAPMYPEGSFRANGGYERFLTWSRPHDGEVPYDSGVGPNTGVIRSGPFRLPSAIHFFTAGFLSRPGLRIYLSDEKSSRTLDLSQRIDPGMKWRMHFWNIPAGWQGSTVRLIAEDNAKGAEDWICITAPKAGGEPLVLSLVRAFNRSGLIVFFGLLILLPGIALALLLGDKTDLDFVRLVSTVVCGSGAICYLGFWLYLASPPAGKIYSILLLGSSAIYIAYYRKLFAKMSGIRESVACMTLIFTLSVFYSAIGFLYMTDDAVGEQAQTRFNPGFMPPDNLLPDMLAERLYRGEPVKPTLFDFWHSSDRPPLQASMEMMVFPLSPIELTLAYQLLGVFLQGFWVAGLWALIRSAGLGSRWLLPVLGFAILSELCIFHSIYVWPKLMASGYLLLAVAQVFRHLWTWLDVILAATCLSLGMLSHPSVLFTIVPVAIFAAFMHRLPGWKKLAAGLGVMLIFLLPWRWYQTVYDPPGDYLIKANLSYTQDPALLKLPLGELLRRSYSGLTLDAFLEDKLRDWQMIFGFNDIPTLLSGDWRKALASFVDGSFFHLFWCIGLLNIAFAFRFTAKKSASLRTADEYLLIVGGSVLIWVCVLFQPGATSIHQGSLANVLLIYAALVIYLVESRPQMIYPLLAVQVICVAPLLIFAKPFIEQRPGAILDAPLDPGMAAVALLTLIGMIYAGWRAKLQEI